MTARDMLLEILIRYHLVIMRWLLDGPFAGVSPKTVEAAVASRIEDGTVVGHPFDGRTKVYGLTPRAARLHGLSPRRFSKPPGMQAILQGLLEFRFCTAGPILRKRLTEAEFSKAFPDLAAARGVCRTRYFMDRRQAQPRLAVMCPDFGAAYHRVAKKAAAAISKRKAHEPFRTFIYNGLFLPVVLTGFERKAARVRQALTKYDLPCPVEVEVVPGFGDLLLRGRGNE